MVPNQVRGEMVLDGGGHFIPAGIDGFHTLSLLLASLVAHARATEDTHIHTGNGHKYTRRRSKTYHVGTLHNPRQGGINFLPL